MLHQVVLKELLQDGCVAAQVLLGDHIRNISVREGMVRCSFHRTPRVEDHLRWTADSMTPSLSASRWSMQRNTFSHRTFGHRAYGIFPP